MWEYTDKVKKHFFEPHNVGEIENPDGVGEVGSLACGDALKLTFKLDSDGRIADAKFKTFGCASAIATSSLDPRSLTVVIPAPKVIRALNDGCRREVCIPSSSTVLTASFHLWDSSLDSAMNFLPLESMNLRPSSSLESQASPCLGIHSLLISEMIFLMSSGMPFHLSLFITT